jgi:hypothetical protein
MRRTMMSIPLALTYLALAACAPANPTTEREAAGTVDLNQESDFRDAMRDLWSDHVIWTRAYIIAAVDGDSSAGAAAARLMKNQEEIGAAIVPYYGAEAGDRLTKLLKEHISIAVELVGAAKAGNKAKQTSTDSLWHNNAADIATFLSEANPENWSRQSVLEMLNEHLSLTSAQAVNRLQHKWEEDVANFDRIHDQAMMMADALSGGIIKQFPDKF